MFWLLCAAHGTYSWSCIILSHFSQTWDGKSNVIHAVRLWDCVVGFAWMELSVWSVTKKVARSALWSHSIILSELSKYLSTKLKWCFKPCYLLNYMKVMSRLTCFVVFGLPSVGGNGISTICRNLVAVQCNEWVFLKKKKKWNVICLYCLQSARKLYLLIPACTRA